MKLHHQIFLAMLIGAALGAITQEQSTLLGVPVLASYDLVGTLFINALKMVVALKNGPLKRLAKLYL